MLKEIQEIIKMLNSLNEKIDTKEYNFTNLEKEILKAIKEEYKYIARDKYGSLYVYTKKPNKEINLYNGGMWTNEESCCKFCVEPFNNLFDCIKWEDKEPCEFRKYLD